WPKGAALSACFSATSSASHAEERATYAVSDGGSNCAEPECGHGPVAAGQQVVEHHHRRSDGETDEPRDPWRRRGEYERRCRKRDSGHLRVMTRGARVEVADHEADGDREYRNPHRPARRHVAFWASSAPHSRASQTPSTRSIASVCTVAPSRRCVRR